MDHTGDGALLWFADEKVGVLGPYNLTGDDETVATPFEFERVFKEIARGCGIEIADAVIITESQEVRTTRVFVTDESSWHRG